MLQTDTWGTGTLATHRGVALSLRNLYYCTILSDLYLCIQVFMLIHPTDSSCLFSGLDSTSIAALNIWTLAFEANSLFHPPEGAADWMGAQLTSSSTVHHTHAGVMNKTPSGSLFLACRFCSEKQAWNIPSAFKKPWKSWLTDINAILSLSEHSCSQTAASWPDKTEEVSAEWIPGSAGGLQDSGTRSSGVLLLLWTLCSFIYLSVLCCKLAVLEQSKQSWTCKYGAHSVLPYSFTLKSNTTHFFNIKPWPLTFGFHEKRLQISVIVVCNCKLNTKFSWKRFWPSTLWFNWYI